LIIALFDICSCQEIQLAWDRNTEEDLAGYRLYQSGSSGNYDFSSPIARIPASADRFTVLVPPTGTFYWVLTAFDYSGNESLPSNEVWVTLNMEDPSSYQIHLENLVDQASFKNIHEVGAAQEDILVYKVEGQPGDLILEFEIYGDGQEGNVEILVNGVSYGNAPLTSDVEYSSPFELYLNDDAISDENLNFIVFRNARNAGRNSAWGVASIVLASPGNSQALAERVW